MKRRFFTIGVMVMMSIIIVVVIGSIMFSKTETVFNEFVVHEKELGKLFQRYEKYNESMTELELTTWQKEVDIVSSKAAQAFIEASKVAEDHDTISLADKYRRFLKAQSMYLSGPEYTGIADKELSEISSGEFDAWISARDAQRNDHVRKWLRALGEDTEEEIEAWIASSNEQRNNDPQRQKNREKMRQVLLENESLARSKALRHRENAQYQAKRQKDKAFIAAEASKFDNADWDVYDAEHVENQPPVISYENQPATDNISQLHVNSIEKNEFTDSVDVNTQSDPYNTFDPDNIADILSKDMSDWDDGLIELYPEIFRLKDAESQHVFEQSLPPDARDHFQQRKQRMQHEYIDRLHVFILDRPTEHREHILQVVRETLEKNWNSDFADTIIQQLQLDDK